MDNGQRSHEKLRQRRIVRAFERLNERGDYERHVQVTDEHTPRSFSTSSSSWWNKFCHRPLLMSLKLELLMLIFEAFANIGAEDNRMPNGRSDGWEADDMVLCTTAGETPYA